MSIVIRAERLSKEYRLGVINHGMLYKDLQSWAARKLGKTDPHSRLDEEISERPKDRFWALKGLDFEIEQGDRVGIIGRNGAGKSTLLKILSRITAPTEGIVKLRGRVASLLEVGTGFHPELTGRENIYLNGAILGLKRSQIKERLDEIVAFSEIEQFIDTPVKRYSSGMYVRLAFSVAAHLDSEILLMDEVLAVGDAAFQKKSIAKMKSLSQGGGRTILFVSHQMQYIASLCNKGILLSGGRIAEQGKIEDIVSMYQNTGDRKGAHRWVNVDEEFPFGDILVPRLLEICNPEGQATDTVSDQGGYYIHVVVEIKKPDPRISVGLGFYDDSDNLMFVSELYDSFPAEKVSSLSGTVEFRIGIPKDILLSLNYSVELLADLHYTAWIMQPKNSSRIHFHYLPATKENWYSGDLRLGKMMVPMKWVRK
jgi:lipopolysaccharide transport system ATP-binding protein